MKPKHSLLYFLACALSAVCFNSCTLTVSPDGTRTYGLDQDAAAAITTTIIETESGK